MLNSLRPRDSGGATPHGEALLVVVQNLNDCQVINVTSTDMILLHKITIPAAASKGVKWHPSASAIIMSPNTSPFIYGYPYSPATGFGTKFADPLSSFTGIAIARGIMFTPPGDAVLFGVGSATTSTRMQACRFDPVTGFGTKYASNASVTNPLASIAMHPDGAHYACGMTGGTNPSIHNWNYATGFDSSSLTCATSNISNKPGMGWTPDGKTAIAAGDISPYIYAWPQTFGAANPLDTPYANPAVLPSLQAEECVVSPDGKFVAIRGTVEPYIEIYHFDAITGWGTKVAAPASPLGAYPASFIWVPSGDRFIAGTNAALVSWAWSPAGYGTRFADFAISNSPVGMDIIATP